MRRLVIPAALGALALALTACGNSSTGAGTAPKPSDSTSDQSSAVSFDFSSIKPDPAVEALVPKDIKERGVLRNGASTDYPPLEMLKEDGTTPTGAEVDLVKAIALTMGLSDGTTTTETFAALLPKVGSTYDVGASGFTVTDERVQAYDMLAYKDMGTLYAVAKGNPKGFDPTSPCGANVGVQTGTYQETDLLPKLNEECISTGKPEIIVSKEDLVDSAVTKVIGGQYDAIIADDPVISFNVKKSGGQIEESGEIFDAAPLAVVVNRDNQELSKAVKAALDSLLKSGKLKEILSAYGADGGLYPEIKLNTSVK